jgi:hypothetical protein
VATAHCTISGQATHYARVGRHLFPAWRMANGDEVVDLRTSTHVHGELAVNDSFLRTAGVPEHVIAAAKTSEPTPGFLCITGAAS